MKCIKGLEIQVVSCGYYYIGTIVEGEPNCQLSEEYYDSLEEAEAALEAMCFTVRFSVEAQFCSQGKSCL